MNKKVFKITKKETTHFQKVTLLQQKTIFDNIYKKRRLSNNQDLTHKIINLPRIKVSEKTRHIPK